MSITSTTLAADLSATGLTMSVTSGSGFPTVASSTPASFIVQVDDEYMIAVSQPVSGTIKLRSRGYFGTAAAPHDILSRVHVSSAASDFPGNPVGGDVPKPP